MNKKLRLVLLLSVICICGCLMGCQKQDSAWKGTISDENGVTVVKNPKEPMYGADVFSLEEELAITDDAGGDECIFSQIRGIDVDASGRIYILDWREAKVFIFDSDGTYIKTFGRQGQGPGEMNMPVTIKITSRNEIAVGNLRQNMNFYTLEGDFVRNINTAKAGSLGMTIDSDYNLFGTLIVQDEENPRYELIKFDPEMNRLHSYGSSPLPDERNFNPFSGGTFVYAVRYDDFVFFGDHQTYEILVYNPSGKIVKKISKVYDPVVITQEEKDRIMERMPPDIKVSIPKFHTPYYWFYLDDEGRIFVQTNEKVEEGDGYYYDVFNPEGKCLAKIPLKMRPYLIKKNKLYTVESDEEGFLTVKRYRIDWKI